jgi:hypothetical protein
MYCTFHLDMTSNFKQEEMQWIPFQCLAAEIQQAIKKFREEYNLPVIGRNAHIEFFSNGYYMFIPVKDSIGTEHRIDISLD